ncbi:MAG: hypothetical protein KDA85_10485, partial [Planctomycetaceae bacterium]|nr:hypothetical protein [Planctomycetaceae bacterium]
MATTLRCSLALAVAVASLISAGCDLPTELQPKVSRSPRPDPAAGADLQNATSTEPLPAVSSVQQYPDPRFQSPEAVFAAAQTAAATGQWSEYCQCLSESGLRRLARTLLFSAIMESHLSQIPGLDDGQSNATAIVLRKYGVPSEYTTDPQK